MLEGFMVPANTTVTASGESTPFSIAAARHRVFLMVVGIATTVEQEAIEISLFGSPDGETWPPKAIATLPQRYYPGNYPTLVDLTANGEIDYLRARWDLTRWGRGDQTPHFTFSLTVRELSPADLLL